MSASPPAPTDKVKILTVDDQNVECIATKWPSTTVASSAFYAKAHWRAKATLITDKVTQFGVAKISAPGNAKYIVYARVVFPKQGDEVDVPEQLKNDRGRYSGPVFFNPPSDLPVDCERLEEVPHELYAHVMGDIKWPSILKRRNLVNFADPVSGETRQVPLLPSYLYDERVKYERWKVTILTWWEANRGGRVGHHRLMRWQNIFQDFRREFASYPYEAGAVRRFSSIVQAYERELQAGRPMKIENWLAAEDQHHRAGAAAVSMQRVTLNADPKAAAAASAAEAAAPHRLPVAQSALSSSSSSEASDDDDASGSDSDAGAKKAPAAGKSAMAAARQRMRAHLGSASDSDSDSDSESESHAPAPAKAAGKRPAPAAAAAKPAKRAAAAASSSSDDSGSESDSESEPEVKPAAKKAAAAAAPAASKKKAAPVSDSESSSEEEERPTKQAIAAATAAAAAKAKAGAAGKGRVNYDDSDDSDSDSDSGKRAAKAAPAKKAAAAPAPAKRSSKAAEPSSESESSSDDEAAKARAIKAKAKAAKK